jgi:hypothetical protein
MMVDEGVDVRVRYLRVTNNTPQIWTDTYDGVPVTIMPGQVQQIPLDMATHFFGWHPDVKPIEMMHHLAKRRGWTDPKFQIYDDPIHEQKVADEVFRNFQIEPVTYKLVEERPAARAREPVPALTDEDVAEERLREPTSVKDTHHDEPRAAPYRGSKPPPKKPTPPLGGKGHGRDTEGD